VYFMAAGVVVSQGTAQEIIASDKPFVHQFVHGETDGPVAFHYAGNSYATDLGLQSERV
jgi:phospholipid/cholesterol/gamma-HCH transport system ATP-binding protein